MGVSSQDNFGFVAEVSGLKPQAVGRMWDGVPSMWGALVAFYWIRHSIQTLGASKQIFAPLSLDAVSPKPNELQPRGCFASELCDYMVEP